MRKGVEFLIRAFLPLAEENPRLKLDLVGKDTQHPTLPGTIKEFLLSKYIPQELRERITFHDSVKRNQIWQFYEKASIGVVPSRWDNYPFVCQEMLACGLPVVATRNGGMAEMIEHGVSGLLCDSESIENLKASLKEMLIMNANRRNQMGQAGAQRINAICNNQEILKSTLNYCEELVDQSKRNLKLKKSVKVPSNLPFSDRSLAIPHPTADFPKPKEIKHVAAIIPYFNMQNYIGECVKSLLNQTHHLQQIYIVNDGSTDPEAKKTIQSWEDHECVKVLHYSNGGLSVARNRGAKMALQEGCQALIFLDADDQIRPNYIKEAVNVMNHHPEVGAVTAWSEAIGLMNTYWIPPHASFPYLLADNTSTPAAVVRAEAYRRVGEFCPKLKYAFEDWDFWISLCEVGYAMLMLPKPHIIYRMRKNSMSQLYTPSTREHGRRIMLEQHPELYQRYGGEALILLEQIQLKSQKRLLRILEEKQETTKPRLNFYQRLRKKIKLFGN